MKASGCGKLELNPLTGIWYRALNLRHWRTRLSTDHTRSFKSRFSSATPESPLYRILYLGENHVGAIYEVNAVLGDPEAPVANPRGSWVLMSLDVRLHYVADLCDPAQQRLISTTKQELTGVWVGGDQSTVPTMQLGAALHARADLEGFLYPSSKTGCRNLAIFTDKLAPSSRIAFRNELSGVVEDLR